MSKPIIVITGPTASGKTSLAFSVARHFPAEVICSDSMTVYRGMNIGTDKPTLRDVTCDGINLSRKPTTNSQRPIAINGIPHHLIDIVDPDQEFNVALFKKLAIEKIEEITLRGNLPFIVGGSTLYIDALVYDFKFPQVTPDPLLRQDLENKSEEVLFQKLVTLDPDAEWTIDRNNKRRLIRALEVCLKSGKPFTKQKQKKKLPENVLYLAVKRERPDLYDDINRRVDEMIGAGFVDEVKKLRSKYDHNTAMQAAGYRQLSEYLDGKITLANAIEKTKQVHRNYAKRQLTWLNKNDDITWVKSAAEAEKVIQEFLKSKIF